MNKFKLMALCLKCGGDGTYLHRYVLPDGSVEFIEEPCESCGGEGKFHYGDVDGAQDIDWIKRKIQKIMVKLDIPDDD